MNSAVTLRWGQKPWRGGLSSPSVKLWDHSLEWRKGKAWTLTWLTPPKTDSLNLCLICQCRKTSQNNDISILHFLNLFLMMQRVIHAAGHQQVVINQSWRESIKRSETVWMNVILEDVSFHPAQQSCGNSSRSQGPICAQMSKEPIRCHVALCDCDSHHSQEMCSQRGLNPDKLVRLNCPQYRMSL